MFWASERRPSDLVFCSRSVESVRPVISIDQYCIDIQIRLRGSSGRKIYCCDTPTPSDGEETHAACLSTQTESDIRWFMPTIRCRCPSILSQDAGLEHCSATLVIVSARGFYHSNTVIVRHLYRLICALHEKNADIVVAKGMKPSTDVLQGCSESYGALRRLQSLSSSLG